MIQLLKLHRFQIHEEDEIALSPQITVLSGRTEAGKSAFLRALRWVALNRPSGTNFIHQRTGKTNVTIETDKGTVERERGPATNVYRANEETFQAPGTSVPSQVQKILGLDHLNFQQQHDGPFWVGLSAGEIARELNGIMNLGLIDHTLSNLNRTLREVRTRAEISQERLQEAKTSQDSLSWSETAHDELEALEGRWTDIQEKRQRASRIDEIALEGSRAYQTAQNAAETASEGGKVLSRGRKAVELRERVEILYETIAEIRQCQQNLEIAKEACQEAQREFEEKIGERCPTCLRPFEKV